MYAHHYLPIGGGGGGGGGGGEMERATDTVWFVRIPVSSPQAAWNSAVWT